MASFFWKVWFDWIGGGMELIQLRSALSDRAPIFE